MNVTPKYALQFILMYKNLVLNTAIALRILIIPVLFGRKKFSKISPDKKLFDGGGKTYIGLGIIYFENDLSHEINYELIVN